MDDEPIKRTDPPAAKLPFAAHLLCGWPILLVVIGGLVGGGLGGGAYAINLKIYKSQLPLAAKIVLIPLIGVGAILLWLAIAIAIQAVCES